MQRAGWNSCNGLGGARHQTYIIRNNRHKYYTQRAGWNSRSVLEGTRHQTNISVINIIVLKIFVSLGYLYYVYVIKAIWKQFLICVPKNTVICYNTSCFVFFSSYWSTSLLQNSEILKICTCGISLSFCRLW